MLDKLFDMRTVTTRDLLHRTREVRAALERGETIVWTSHGKIVAHLQPPGARVKAANGDWLARAKAAGAVNRSKESASSLVYGDRD